MKKKKKMPPNKKTPKNQKGGSIFTYASAWSLLPQCYTQAFSEQATVFCLNDSELAEFLHTDNSKKLSFVS